MHDTPEAVGPYSLEPLDTEAIPITFHWQRGGQNSWPLLVFGQSQEGSFMLVIARLPPCLEKEEVVYAMTRPHAKGRPA